MKPLTVTVASPSKIQDRNDLDFALEVPGGVDIVALSFVQKAGDVEELKSLVQGRCRVRGPIRSRTREGDKYKAFHP